MLGNEVPRLQSSPANRQSPGLLSPGHEDGRVPNNSRCGAVRLSDVFHEKPFGKNAGNFQYSARPCQHCGD